MASNVVKTDSKPGVDGTFPMGEFEDLNSPGESSALSARVELELQLAEVPLLKEGRNADLPTVHHRLPENSDIQPGATLNLDTQTVSVLVEADLHQVEGLEMVIFDDPAAEIPSHRIVMKEIHQWSEPLSGEAVGQFYVALEGNGIKPGMTYGFRVQESPDGPGCSPATRWAGDPHGKAVVASRFTSLEREHDAPRLGPEYVIPQKSIVLSIEERDGIVSFPGVDGLEPIKRTPLSAAPHGQRVYYEMHVQSTRTMPDEILEPELRGTQGTIKALQSQAFIDRMKAQEVTHVQLLPCQAYFSEWFLQVEGQKNAWGYMPESFYGVHDEYFSVREPHAQIREFIETINVLHENGIGVVIDWVPGHTHEGEREHADGRQHPMSQGPSGLLRPFAERLYYQLKEDGSYRHDSGCGNTVSANFELGRKLLLSSRDHWLNTIGVDGLRVDQASLLGRGRDGKFYDDHGFLEDFANVDPSKEVIAEPNDVHEGGEQFVQGRFPGRRPGQTGGWKEWSFAVRNINQDFARGHAHFHYEDSRPLAGALAHMIAGSQTVYGDPNSPEETYNNGITYSAVHDGLTTKDFADLVIQERLNGSGEVETAGVRAGLTEEHTVEKSFHSSIERLKKQGVDEAEIPEVLAKRTAIGLMATNIFKPGDILLSRGDEDLRSQNGNHNAWCNPELIGLNWGPSESREIVSGMMKLRDELEVFNTARHFSKGTGIRWYSREGSRRLLSKHWEDKNDGFLGVIHTNFAPGQNRKKAPVFVARGEGQYILPELPEGWGWLRRFDSTRENPLQEKLHTIMPESDSSWKNASFHGPAGVAVYEMVRTKELPIGTWKESAASPQKLERLDQVRKRYRVVRQDSLKHGKSL